MQGNIEKKLILVRIGEIALKGLNRRFFEDRLIKNIKYRLRDLGKCDVWRSQSRTYITPLEDGFDFDEALERLTKVFGIVSISEVFEVEPDIEIIKQKALIEATKQLQENDYKTFKVEGKRGDKSFHLTSQEIGAEVGGYLLDNLNTLVVDVKNPDFKVFVEIREMAYVYTKIIQASGGMPLGTNGSAMLLMSGGIDSPVAGWTIAKRGVELSAIHFYSYPYTSERAKQKVIDLCKILTQYCGSIRLYVVHFTEIQLAIYERCTEDQTTVIMRRVMMKIADTLAQRVGAKALITGESLGQVASQTIESLGVTNAAATLPVFRPLIGMDKNEIVALARKIGTFDTSILPYEDCCTVFVPKHPATKPKLVHILASEEKLLIDDLIDSALQNIETISL